MFPRDRGLHLATPRGEHIFRHGGRLLGLPMLRDNLRRGQPIGTEDLAHMGLLFGVKKAAQLHRQFVSAAIEARIGLGADLVGLPTDLHRADDFGNVDDPVHVKYYLPS